REVRELWRWTRLLALPSVLGAALGAWLVVAGDEQMFRAMVPWLICLATALFVLQPRLSAVLQASGASQPTDHRWLVTALQQSVLTVVGSSQFEFDQLQQGGAAAELEGLRL
ncbi:MAG: TSUP family transporter, partial [Planctomycetaceae bacterium]